MRRGRGTAAPGALLLGLALVAGLLVAAPASSGAAPADRARMSGPLQRLASGQASQRSMAVPEVRQGGPYDPSATGPGSLIETDEGILVQAFSDHLTAAVERDLVGAGATLVDSDRGLGIATVRVPVDDLDRVASVDGVRYVAEVLEPVIGRSDGLDAAGLAAAVQPSCGSAHSEGDAQLHADALRAAWDTEGSGVEVGILSDSWDVSGQDARSAAEDIASGDLPGTGNPCPGPERTTPADVLAEGPSDGTDEGRAMGQIVHDLAPAAHLSFATAYDGDTSFAANIRALRDHGAKVLVDDVFYYNEPAYQNGPIGVAVDDVIGTGSSYLSALGNENEIVAGHPVASYEAQAFRPSTCPAGVPGTCHDFDPGSGTDPTLGFTVAGGGKINMTLKWDEPWNGVVTDYDLYFLVDGTIVGSSQNVNPGGTQQPFEAVFATVTGSAAKTVDVVVSRKAGATTTPRFRLEHMRSDLTGAERLVAGGTDVIGPDAVGHPVVPRAVALGAVPASDSSQVEPFSSRGPATWYWGPVSGSGAAARLASPQVIAKPDLAASDRVSTTFFYDRLPPYEGPFVFAGTSAAAPHAAAVAALLRACNPSLTPDQVKAALTSTAVPVAGGVPETVGAGLVSAKAAGDHACLAPSTLPRFSISDSSAAEGTSTLLGTKSMSFTVSLSKAAPAATSVTYQTVDGTAVAGSDYNAKGPTVLTFSKGQISKTVTVAVRSDSAHEPDEQLGVRLSSPVGAGIADDLGVGTILDDDPLPPEVRVSDASVVEGSATGVLSSKTITFTISLSGPAPGSTSVVYQTIDGTAAAGSDYTAKKATKLTFSKGQTSKTVSITVKQDKVHEGNELFYLVLTSPDGMTIADDTGVGVIVDDD